jgi:signal peptidase II
MASQGNARWFWLSTATLVADRASKYLVEQFTGESFRRELLPGMVTLVHSRNPGIAFGLFSDHPSGWLTALLVAGSSIVIALLAWVLASGRAGGTRAQAGIALILGGAAGNLLDRLLHGGVTDFFYVHLRSFRWPAFNLADSAITIGALLIVLELLFGHHDSAEHASV